MKFCTHCGRSFSLDESLLQHIAMHPRIRPYECVECHMSFTRIDLLDRHQIVHGNNKTSVRNENSSKRIKNACERCSIAKAKCDGIKPCRNCRDRNLECILRVSRRKAKRGQRQKLANLDTSGVNTSPNAHAASQALTDLESSTPDQLQKREHGEDTLRNGWRESVSSLLSPSGDANAVSSATHLQTDSSLPPGTFVDPSTYTVLPTLSLTTAALISEADSAKTPAVSDNFLECKSSDDGRVTSRQHLPTNTSEGLRGSEISPCGSTQLAHEPSQTNPSLLQNGRNAFADKWKKPASASAENHEQCFTGIESEGFSLEIKRLNSSTQQTLAKAAKSFLQMGSGQGDLYHIVAPSPRNDGPKLPSFARLLEHLLCLYGNSVERHYPTIPKGVLDLNELMNSSYPQAASLLALTMAIHGVLSIPGSKGRVSAAISIQAGRILLSDLLERRLEWSHDPIGLQLALLLTLQGRWNGDSDHVENIIDQREKLFALVRDHAAATAANAPDLQTTLNRDPHLNESWHDWLQHEKHSRLLYSWVIVDQEISLFQDKEPLLSADGITAPMPDVERLWKAKTADDWYSVFTEVHQLSAGIYPVGSGARPSTLRVAFRRFLMNRTSSEILTATQMRLLLHPLQSIVCEYNELARPLSQPPSDVRQFAAHAFLSASARLAVADAQKLLDRWFELSERHTRDNGACTTMQNGNVMFHLISLNTFTDFRLSERIALGENLAELSLQQCIRNLEAAVYHCGQVLMIFEGMKCSIRPPWWPAAIYRTAIILWACGKLCCETDTQIHENTGPAASPLIAVDSLPTEATSLVLYRTKRWGRPCITSRDGSLINLQNHTQVVQRCTEIAGGGIPTALSKQIQVKLGNVAFLSSVYDNETQ